ncbi:PAX-interacting protein 1-like [Sitophilus oryzae]|uniref:PAX-interacting protein 1-like n=1 Tax=Sitophilus oryzae TaxID=7048 RepID=A0A6J2X4M9_SITOR|nr:PAX-interacting protein 1-like [Sitophilus oryzae]
MKKFYVILFITLTGLPNGILSKSKKKSIKTTTESSQEQTTSQPAIIAIQIVDPAENSTSKNLKRTIEDALGYGYNSLGSSKPRYEVYKYSQHDIPPYKGIAKGPSSSAIINTPISIQKSVQYTLPTITHYEKVNQALQPGTTLYSTVSGKGQISELSSNAPQPSYLQQSQEPIPVIVLRIYPDQLKDSTLQANLPDSHPFAKTINSINIQSLLTHYIKALKEPEILSQYSSSHNSPNRYNTKQSYRAPSVPVNSARPINNYYNRENVYSNAQNYQNSDHAVQNQNYQYHQQPSYTPIYNPHPEVAQSASRLRNNPTHGYRTQPKQQQYYYQSHQVAQPVPNDYPSNQYYSANYQNEYNQQPSAQSQSISQLQQYLSSKPINYNNEYQQGYYQDDSEQQLNSHQLLTHENYPSSQHTNVVFKTDSGEVRSAQQQQVPEKQVKTIKIQVPDNIAKVEVQESEKPYYPYGINQESDKTPQDEEQSQGYYYLPTPAQNAYFTETEPPIQRYQDVNYDDMVKYFTRRGIASGQLLQNEEDQRHQETDHQNSKQPNTKTQKSPTDRPSSVSDIIAAYDEAFPTTTVAAAKKKLKSKKRIYH